MIKFKPKKIYAYKGGAIFVLRRNKCSLHVVVIDERDTIEMDCGYELPIKNHTAYVRNLTLDTDGDVEACHSPRDGRFQLIRATDEIPKFNVELLFRRWPEKNSEWMLSYQMNDNGITAKHALNDDTRTWRDTEDW